jgi:ParB family chromosome partitioning protein
MNVIEVPVDAINVGERRRQDMGDIEGLANGIKRVGLLEPIIVDRCKGVKGYRLVAGERRLLAVQSLEWETIPAVLRAELTEEQVREIEIEENENRKSFTEQERRRTFASSKRLLEKAKKAEEVLRTTRKTAETGRPTKGGASQVEIAEALDTNRRTIERAEKHVATAERFPWMQGNDWRQSDVLRFQERLEELTPEAQEQMVGILGAAKILDPELTVELIENVGRKKPEEITEIYRLSQSDDPRQRSLALSKAADKPPLPDPRLGIIDNASHILNAAIKPYPHDPLTPDFIDVRRNLARIRAAVKAVSYDAQIEQQKRQEAMLQ